MSEHMQTPAFLPTLAYEDLDRAIAFYKQLGYTEGHTMVGPDGKALHTMLTTPCGRVTFMAGFDPEFKGPANGFTFYGYAPEGVTVDQMYASLKGAGAPISYELTDEFWGDRRFGYVDPEGYKWFCAQRVGEMQIPEGVSVREPAMA